MGPKKQKQTMSLGNFLSDQTLGSWADEMEDMPMPYSRGGYGADRGERRGFGSSGGFGDRPGFSERNYQPREVLPLPTGPPYTAHLGNLSFDVTSEDIQAFFGDAKVTNVRLVEDKIDRRPKGFGYVEFETLEGLKAAIDLNGTSFQGRSIKISVADPPKDRPLTRELNDWTRKGPLPDLPSQPSRRISSGPPRSFDAGSDAGSERSSSRRGPPMFEGDSKPRDFGTWERRGPLSPMAGAAPGGAGGPGGPGGPRDRPRARGGDRSFERRPSPAWGEGTDREGSRPPRPPQPERTPTAAEMDTQWRARMRPDPPTPTTQTPEASVPSSPAATQTTAPAMRPKLNLQKRTVSEAPSDAPTSAVDSKASPFGAARPIDTATRDAEVAQKREAARLQKEAEDKAKAEKAAAEKAEAAPRKPNNRNSVPPTPTRGMSAQENGNSKAKKGAKTEEGAADTEEAAPDAIRFSILQRDDEQEQEDPEGVDASANGTIIDDKAVKPKEVVRPKGKGADAQSTPATADKLEGDGWETVSKGNPKGGRHRRGASQNAARALAS